MNVLGGLFSLLVVVFLPHIQKRRASPDLGKKTCDWFWHEFGTWMWAWTQPVILSIHIWFMKRDMILVLLELDKMDCLKLFVHIRSISCAVATQFPEWFNWCDADLSLFGASKKKSFLASAKLLEESAIWLSHVFPTRSWIGLKFCSGQNLPLKQDCRDQNVSDLLCFFTFFSLSFLLSR